MKFISDRLHQQLWQASMAWLISCVLLRLLCAYVPWAGRGGCWLQECHEDLASLYAALEAGLEERDENVGHGCLLGHIAMLRLGLEHAYTVTHTHTSISTAHLHSASAQINSPQQNATD
jgi:hypothetical protein